MSTLEPQTDAPQSFLAALRKAASVTKTSEAEIHTLDLDLSNFQAEGVFIEVSVHNVGVMERKLTWDALGVVLPKKEAITVRPPHCAMVPDKYRLPIQREASAVYDLHKKLSFELSLIKLLTRADDVRWIPHTAWDSFVDRFTAQRGRLKAEIAKLVAVYPTVREEVWEHAFDLAKGTARRLSLEGAQVPSDYDLADAITSLMPTIEQLESIDITYDFAILRLGDQLNQQRARDLEAKTQLKIARHDYEIEQYRTWREQQTIDELAQAELASKQKMLELQRQAEQQAWQQAFNPVEEALHQIYQVQHDAFKQYLASIKKHGHIPASTSKGMADAIRTYQIVKAWKDGSGVDELLAEAEALRQAAIGQPKAKRAPSVKALESCVEKIVAETYKYARQYSQPHRLANLEA